MREASLYTVDGSQTRRPASLRRDASVRQVARLRESYVRRVHTVPSVRLAASGQDPHRACVFWCHLTLDSMKFSSLLSRRAHQTKPTLASSDLSHAPPPVMRRLPPPLSRLHTPAPHDASLRVGPPPPSRPHRPLTPNTCLCQPSRWPAAPCWSPPPPPPPPPPARPPHWSACRPPLLHSNISRGAKRSQSPP